MHQAYNEPMQPINTPVMMPGPEQQGERCLWGKEVRMCYEVFPRTVINSVMTRKGRSIYKVELSLLWVTNV